MLSVEYSQAEYAFSAPLLYFYVKTIKVIIIHLPPAVRGGDKPGQRRLGWRRSSRLATWSFRCTNTCRSCLQGRHRAAVLRGGTHRKVPPGTTSLCTKQIIKQKASKSTGKTKEKASLHTYKVETNSVTNLLFAFAVLSKTIFSTWFFQLFSFSWMG